MIRLLECEYRKTRGRYVFLTALALTILSLVWILWGNYGEFEMQNGWMMFLYQLPMLNTIFMPILAMVTASRLCDIEHKGGMFKQLLTLAPKGKVYDAKLVYGISVIAICSLIHWGMVLAFGYVKGFEGKAPLKLYLIYLLFTLVPTIAVYLFQHVLSIVFPNQAAAFFVGIIGAFAGLFSLFLPFPVLPRLLLWGYYGELQFVWLFGWTKEARYAEAYYEAMGFDWAALAMIGAACIIIYVVGKILFCRKEA
ncbi:MAG: ABC transporter permease [Bacteroidales bacterium]|nr:ABC transporter permease [Lachnoclostridium sp.]MCM1384309.1 ABC transporter permease [Lachnoclostridium sp.]MCM1464890.1 ABC transporter permease [Bacteroidales bacterium]